MPEQGPNYSDRDITFFMGLYHDRERADGALARLREHFPEARLIVRSDGDEDPKNRELAQRHSAEYYQEDRLYPIEHGASMIIRILELYLENLTPYLLKIDTDTAIYRRFRFLPEQSGTFGSLQRIKPGAISIQGGFTGFSEDAARAMLNSGVLKDPRLKDPWSHRDESVYFDRMGRRANRMGLCSFDWIIGWAATELQIPIIDFSEVHCRWLPQNNVKNEDLAFAATHPVYFE